MKKLYSALLFACALVIPTSLTAATFEGKVRMQISSGSAKKGEVQDMDYRIKDGLVRIDIQLKDKSGKPAGVSPGVIMDAKKQEMTMLMPEQKMYMVHSLAGAEGKPGAKHDTPEKAPDFSLDKTGETEKILGYACEKYVMKSDKTVTEMWLTSELGNFMGLGSGAASGLGRRGAGAQQAQAWEKALAGKSMFPMRVVGLAPDGKETFRMEVTAVEKQSLPASDFAPPADYKKFEMPNMEGMMKGMIPGMGR